MAWLPEAGFPLPKGTRKAELILLGKKQITFSPGKLAGETVPAPATLLEKNRLSQRQESDVMKYNLWHHLPMETGLLLGRWKMERMWREDRGVLRSGCCLQTLRGNGGSQAPQSA